MGAKLAGLLILLTTALISSGLSAPPPSPIQAFTNSLGMKFVRVPNSRVLFSVWLTRVRDYEQFAQEAGNSGGSKWKNPGFAQTPDYPVCAVNFNEAKAFCSWLTSREQAAGLLKSGQSYALPTDAEWILAAGPQTSGSVLPASKTTDRAPHAHGPVGMFAPNAYGILDQGKPLHEWCDRLRHDTESDEALERSPIKVESKSPTGRRFQTLCWSSETSGACRLAVEDPGPRSIRFGFRCVLLPPPSP
jgi:formylglycine-generating enzyme required for sulfatase activity